MYNEWKGLDKIVSNPTDRREHFVINADLRDRFCWRRFLSARHGVVAKEMSWRMRLQFWTRKVRTFNLFCTVLYFRCMAELYNYNRGWILHGNNVLKIFIEWKTGTQWAWTVNINMKFYKHCPVVNENAMGFSVIYWYVRPQKATRRKRCINIVSKKTTVGQYINTHIHKVVTWSNCT